MGVNLNQQAIENLKKDNKSVFSELIILQRSRYQISQQGKVDTQGNSCDFK